eukprot:TRINITY_DN299_c0_g1_i1.p2 TRINITY_DN299_c0_g1~~TRINITY_DN299_c0_g1_i1.p2  ORF type:complete len:158 (+),score=3.27 TRINITY_DN299_c0_g1_i1:99-572(+)
MSGPSINQNNLRQSVQFTTTCPHLSGSDLFFARFSAFFFLFVLNLAGISVVSSTLDHATRPSCRRRECQMCLYSYTGTFASQKSMDQRVGSNLETSFFLQVESGGRKKSSFFTDFLVWIFFHLWFGGVGLDSNRLVERPFLILGSDDNEELFFTIKS